MESSVMERTELESRELEKQDFEVTYLGVDSEGVIDTKSLYEAVREDTILVSIMHVNNETGIIQPVKTIGSFLKNTHTIFHVDATQSCGKLVEEIKCLKYDAMSIAAHKLNGPQGIGALILRKNQGT